MSQPQNHLSLLSCLLPRVEDLATLTNESLCEGKSCLFESFNVYRFSKNFKEYTGFDHVGFDWSMEVGR